MTRVIPTYRYKECIRCDDLMNGIVDYATRDTCCNCGGHAKIDSVEILAERQSARLRKRQSHPPG